MGNLAGVHEAVEGEPENGHPKTDSGPAATTDNAAASTTNGDPNAATNRDTATSAVKIGAAGAPAGDDVPATCTDEVQTQHVKLDINGQADMSV